MKLYYGNTVVVATATREPDYTPCFGRSWDSSWTVIIDGEKCRATVDTTWGRSAHFDYKGQHYRLPIADAFWDTFFDTLRVELTTKKP